MKQLWHSWRDGDFQILASSLSYTTIIALVPFLIVTLSVFQLFHSLDFLYPHLEAFIFSNFKVSAGDDGVKVVKNALMRLQSGKLGPIASVGLMLTSFVLIRDIDRAIQKIWKLNVTRPFYKRWFWYWGVLFLSPFILAAYLALKSVAMTQENVPSIVFSVLGFVLSWLLLSLLNKWIPAKKVSIKHAFVGSFISMVALNILYLTFKWFALKIFFFGKLYGSLAAFPLLLVGIQLFWMTLLSGTWLIANWKETKA